MGLCCGCSLYSGNASVEIHNDIDSPAEDEFGQHERIHVVI